MIYLYLLVPKQIVSPTMFWIHQRIYTLYTISYEKVHRIWCLSFWPHSPIFATGITCSALPHMVARKGGWRFIFSWNPQEMDLNSVCSQAPHSKCRLNHKVPYELHDMKKGEMWPGNHSNEYRIGRDKNIDYCFQLLYKHWCDRCLDQV